MVNTSTQKVVGGTVAAYKFALLRRVNHELPDGQGIIPVQLCHTPCIFPGQHANTNMSLCNLHRYVLILQASRGRSLGQQTCEGSRILPPHLPHGPVQDARASHQIAPSVVETALQPIHYSYLGGTRYSLLLPILLRMHAGPLFVPCFTMKPLHSTSCADCDCGEQE